MSSVISTNWLIIAKLIEPSGTTFGRSLIARGWNCESMNISLILVKENDPNVPHLTHFLDIHCILLLKISVRMYLTFT